MKNSPEKKPAFRLRRINLLHLFIRPLGFVVFNLIYRLRIEGRENLPPAGPAIILPKHQFWTDIPIVGLALWRPLNYIAKRELFVYPVLKHFLTYVGGVPIDRQKALRNMDSFRYVEWLLQQDEWVVLFPEGTYYPQAMGRGKQGFIQVILGFQEKVGRPEERAIPFVPMGIRCHRRGLRTQVDVRIGKPLYAKGKSEAKELTDRIIQEIAGLSGL